MLILFILLILVLIAVIWLLPNLYCRRLDAKMRRILDEELLERQPQEEQIQGADLDRYRSPMPEIIWTFDDGPSSITGEVLDVLKEERQRAVFFVLGERLEDKAGADKTAQQEKRALIERMQAEGHIIGIHAYHHARQLNPLTSYTDGKHAYELLRSYGLTPKFLRAPHGLYNIGHILLLKSLGLKVVHWDSLVGDWNCCECSQILNRIAQALLHHQEALRHKKLKASPVVIVLHDGCAGSADAHAHLRCPQILRMWYELKSSAQNKRATG